MTNELKLRWSKAPERIVVCSPLSVHRCPLSSSHCKFPTPAVTSFQLWFEKNDPVLVFLSECPNGQRTTVNGQRH
jgi:hypothetical protein